LQVKNTRIAHVFYENGPSINVTYPVDDPHKRAVGFELSEGIEAPAKLAPAFKFATQNSKLAGTIRGSSFAFENDHRPRNLELPPARNSSIPGREVPLALKGRDGRLADPALLLCRPRAHLAAAAAPVDDSLGAAVDDRPGPAADVAACS
jgi:hypothetical protein